MPPNLAEDLAQVLPYLKSALNRVAPLLASPYKRLPFVMPLAQSQTILAGQNNQPLLAADFQISLEWDFEVHTIKFSQDASHTFRDWRFLLRDNIASQDLMKNSAMVATLVDDNTGAWKLDYPWIVSKKGGGFQPFVDNLDTANPINVDVAFIGYLLIPAKVR
jgi:hypothetical protein